MITTLLDLREHVTESLVGAKNALKKQIDGGKPIYDPEKESYIKGVIAAHTQMLEKLDYLVERELPHPSDIDPELNTWTEE